LPVDESLGIVTESSPLPVLDAISGVVLMTGPDCVS
jgi:hypothetical protein